MVIIKINSFESIEIDKFADSGAVEIRHVDYLEGTEGFTLEGKELYDFAVAISEYAGLHR